MNTTTFENAKQGDKVWDFAYKEGTIKSIGTKYCGKKYINVVFETRKSILPLTYWTDGVLVEVSEIYPIRTLFWGEIKYEIPQQPPRTKTINGVEIPDISFKPKDGEDYYAIDLTDKSFYVEFMWRDDEMDFTLCERGLCYPYTKQGKQAAILHAKAMLGIKE
jgi:hypothetical protein